MAHPRSRTASDAVGAGLTHLCGGALALIGFVLAGYGPLWLGGEDAVSAAGMIATVSGLILAATALFGPERR